MNTTSMEFILCQEKTNKSPLVLSEFMGTVASFSQALQINPHDLLMVAEAINKGLGMSSAQKTERHDMLHQSIIGHTSHTWAATVLKQLLENVGGEHTAHQTPYLDTAKLASAYKNAKKRLMLFDYDVSLAISYIWVAELMTREPLRLSSKSPLRQSLPTVHFAPYPH